MDRSVLRIFQAEIELQCKFIMAAAHELNAALVTGSGDDIWRHLQSILVASASLSKMFWGSGAGSNEELAKSRQSLRESLAVSDESPLRDVELRNDFEHFDERLERWFATSEHRNYFGRVIGPGRQLISPQPPATDMFQQFDPGNGEVTFWAHTVSLRDLLAEVSRILPLARAEIRKPHWDQPEEPPEEATDIPLPPNEEGGSSGQSEPPPTVEEGPA